jgi:catechol 2,3-dioxygenase-like lactoylglutathione lyase family enzyme
MIGRLHSVVIDCPDPRALAEFYGSVLGTSVTRDDGDWVVFDDGRGGRLAFQRVEGFTPPQWPGQDVPQQVHLDIAIPSVDALDEAEERVIKLGATRLPGSGDDFRVYADPVGHPFCFVW